MLANVATHCYIEQVDLGPLIGFTIVMLIMAGYAQSFAAGSVARPRLERFARRQRLLVTPDNGNQVIRYLATTRRWRVAGLTAGLLISAASTAQLSAVVIDTNGRSENRGVDVVALFVGWFLGALVAEVRVAHLAHGSPRVASLEPRRPDRYLGRFSWTLVPAAAVVAAGVAAGTLLARLAGWAAPDWTAGLWCLLSLAVAVTVRAIQVAVLRRPQPLAAPDVLEADDAIRSRSLHVLAGGGTALVLLCVGGQLDAVRATADRLHDLVNITRGVGVFVVLGLAWNVATAVWPPHRSRAAAGATS
jgi:hypothetical protein